MEMGRAEGGSHQLSKLLYWSKYNRLRCSLLNPVTSTDTRRKELCKDFCGAIIFSWEGPNVVLRTKINVGLLWGTHTLQVVQSEVSNEAKHVIPVSKAVQVWEWSRLWVMGEGLANWNGSLSSVSGGCHHGRMQDQGDRCTTPRKDELPDV